MRTGNRPLFSEGVHMIRIVKESDAKAIVDIYNTYILNTTFTFEEVVVTEEEIRARIQNTLKDWPWLVYEEDKKVLGYAYVRPWKERTCYRYTVEATIYFSSTGTGKGYAQELYQALIEEIKALNIHAILAGITLPNEKSICLHEKLGFEKVAHLKAVGYKFNKWIDVGYWELIL